MLSEGEELSPGFLQHIEHDNRTARDIMITPIITIADTADVVEAAELLSEKRIKRLPVLPVVSSASSAVLISFGQLPVRTSPNQFRPSMRVQSLIFLRSGQSRSPWQPIQLTWRSTRTSCPPGRFAPW
jgi:CBS-domain-containing membrane protein